MQSTGNFDNGHDESELIVNKGTEPEMSCILFWILCGIITVLENKRRKSENHGDISAHVRDHLICLPGYRAEQEIAFVISVFCVWK